MIEIFDFTNVGEICGKRITLEELAKDPIRCIMGDLAKELATAPTTITDLEELRKYNVYSIERAIADIKLLSLVYNTIFDKGELADYIKEYIDICNKWLNNFKNN